MDGEMVEWSDKWMGEWMMNGLVSGRIDHCYSFACVDHMGGSVKGNPFTLHPLNRRREEQAEKKCWSAL